MKIFTVSCILMMICACSVSGPDVTYPLNQDGSFTRLLESGTTVDGWVSDDGVAFQIVGSNGDNFGFQLSENRIEEWSGDDRITIFWNDYEGVATYILNGDSTSLRDIDVEVQWKTVRDGELTSPIGLPVERVKNLFNNPLGTELMDELGEMNKSKFFNEDGSCSGPFMAVIGSCLKWKCPLGGWGNPLCHACVGASFSCLVVAMMALAGGGD